MAKLSRKQTATLGRAIGHLTRARDYIMRDDIAVCHRSLPTTTLHYHRAGDGLSLYEVERRYGSDLTGLDMALAELRALADA